MEEFSNFLINLNKNVNLQIFQSEPVPIDIVNEWKERKELPIMMDVWGEAEALVNLYLCNASMEDLERQWNSFCRCCYLATQSQYITDGLKWELKVEQWLLWSVVFTKYRLEEPERDIIMSWFDQWCYDKNFDAFEIR